MIIRHLVRRDLDEARELQLALGDFLRPDRDLLAILPCSIRPVIRPLPYLIEWVNGSSLP